MASPSSTTRSFPSEYQSVVLIQSKQLEQAQGLVDLLQKLAWVLPVVALLCIGGSIALSRNRRRRVMRAGIWVAVAVALQLALLSVGRNFYLEAITSSGARKGSAGAVWDQLTSFLRQSGTTVIAVALVIAIAAWVAGPSRGATRIRGLWTNALGGGSDVEAGPVATFVARSKTPLPRRRCRCRPRDPHPLEPPEARHRAGCRRPVAHLPRGDRVRRARGVHAGQNSRGLTPHSAFAAVRLAEPEDCAGRQHRGEAVRVLVSVERNGQPQQAQQRHRSTHEPARVAHVSSSRCNRGLVDAPAPPASNRPLSPPPIHRRDKPQRRHRK